MWYQILQFFYECRTLVLSFFQSRRVETELQNEIDHHIALETERNISNGMSPASAKRAAHIQFGSKLKTREECQEALGVRIFEDLIHDVQFGIRQLKKRKFNTATILITLALVLGINNTTYKIYQNLVSNPFHYTDSSRIVKVGTVRSEQNKEQIHHTSVPSYLHMKEHSISFENLGLVDPATNFDLNIGNKITRLSIDKITPEIWNITGLKPVQGRFFDQSIVDQTAGKIVVVSEDLWKQLKLHHGDVDPLNTHIRLNDERYQVIGIAPKDFHLDFYRADAWIPWIFSPEEMEAKNRHRLSFLALGKLRPELTVAQAKDDLLRAYDSYLEQYPQDKENPSKRGNFFGLVNVNRSLIQYFPQMGTAFQALLVITSIILVIGCLNVSGIFITNNESRKQEWAMRKSLGASSFRITRQISCEVILHFLFGGMFSIVVFYSGSTAKNLLMLNEIPWMGEWNLEGSILLYTFGGALICGLITSLFPAVSVLKESTFRTIKEGDRALAGSKQKRRQQSLFIITQIALSSVLTLATILAFQNLRKVLNKDVGFLTQDRIAAEVLYPIHFPKDQTKQLTQKTDSIIQKLNEHPGVIAVSSSSKIPMDYQNTNFSDFEVPSSLSRESASRPVAAFINIRPSYFKTIGSKILEGREFTKLDYECAEKVVIISDSIRKAFFSETSPIDQYIQKGPHQFRIIGVAKQIQEIPHFVNLGSDFGKNHSLYLPNSDTQTKGYSSHILVIHSELNNKKLKQIITKTINETHPRFGVSFREFSEVYKFATIAQSLPLKLVFLFTAFAVFLSTLGLYGFVSHTVLQSTKEFGIRLALGAKPPSLFRMILFRSIRLVSWGLGIGLIISILICLKINGFLPELNTLHPGPFCLVILLIFAVSFLATYIPANRATKIEISEILKHE